MVKNEIIQSNVVKGPWLNGRHSIGISYNASQNHTNVDNGSSANIAISFIPSSVFPKEIEKKEGGKEEIINTPIQEHVQDINSLTKTQLSDKYHSEYKSWGNMKQRCRTKHYTLHPAFKDFTSFLRKLGPKPDQSYSIDRIEHNNPEYSPANCRWASKQLQTENRSNTVYLTDKDGTTLSLPEWARRTNTPLSTFYNRRAKGWTDPDIIHGRSTASVTAKQPSDFDEWDGIVKDPQQAEELYQRTRNNHTESRLVFAYRCLLIKYEELKYRGIQHHYSACSNPEYSPLPFDLQAETKRNHELRVETSRRILNKYGHEIANNIFAAVMRELKIYREARGDK